MDVDGWEEQIDVDDSDLPSLLHLSKSNNNNNSSSRPPPTLLPCSRPPPKEDSPPISDPDPDPNPSTAFRPIPGPAGVLQAKKKMQRQTNPRPSGSNNVVLQAKSQVHDCDHQVDVDFKTTPWLRALSSLGVDSVQCPIGSIKRDRRARRVKEVVGMVSSCRPNRLGDLTVMLKDPTGSIGAFVHHKVLMDSRFSNVDIAVGCVLVLKQVAVFTIRSMFYLNVTLNNVIKGFSGCNDLLEFEGALKVVFPPIDIMQKDCGPPQKSIMSSCGERDSGKHSEAGPRAEGKIPRKLGVGHREFHREDESYETVASDNIAPHGEATKQFSAEKTIKIVNPNGNPDDGFLQGLTGNLAPKDLLNSTPYNRPGTMRAPLAISEAEYTLHESTKPPNVSRSKADISFDDPVSTSASSLCAIPHKQMPNKSRVSTDSNCANASRISDGSLDKLTPSLHATAMSEQDLDRSKATTNSERANMDSLSGDDCSTLASSLHPTNAIARGLLRTPPTRQELGRGGNMDAPQVPNQRLVNGARHFPTNLEDSSSISKQDASPSITAIEPKRVVSKALATDWTDEQLAELFSDHQDGDDMFKLLF